MSVLFFSRVTYLCLYRSTCSSPDRLHNFHWITACTHFCKPSELFSFIYLKGGAVKLSSKKPFKIWKNDASSFCQSLTSGSEREPLAPPRFYIIDIFVLSFYRVYYCHHYGYVSIEKVLADVLSNMPNETKSRWSQWLRPFSHSVHSLLTFSSAIFLDSLHEPGVCTGNLFSYSVLH